MGTRAHDGEIPHRRRRPVALLVAAKLTDARRVTAVGRAVHLTLGGPVRCAVGTVTGLVGVSAVALWIPGMGMELSTILALGASVFTLTTIWEAIAQRAVGKRRVLWFGTSEPRGLL